MKVGIAGLVIVAAALVVGILLAGDELTRILETIARLRP